MKLLPIALVVALSLGAGPLSAETAPAPTAADILAAQQQLRARLERPDGELARLDEAALARIRAAQERIFGLLGGVDSADDLNASERAALTQALDEIAAATAPADSRRSCRQRRTGSRLAARC